MTPADPTARVDLTAADMVARLELERLGGMPRWQVKATEPQVDPLPVIAERLRVLARDYGPVDSGLREAS